MRVIISLALLAGANAAMFCANSDCGCDGSGADWCDESNGVVGGEYCSANEAQCSNCGGIYCSEVDYSYSSGGSDDTMSYSYQFCVKDACGCEANGSPWCTATNYLQPTPWCNESEENCGNCAGVMCRSGIPPVPAPTPMPTPEPTMEPTMEPTAAVTGMSYSYSEPADSYCCFWSASGNPCGDCPTGQAQADTYCDMSSTNCGGCGGTWCA